MVSVITGYGQTQVPFTSWTPDNWRAFQQTVKQVQKLDEDLGEPECIDPGKQEWMDEMERRMQAVEAAAFRNAAFRQDERV